MKAKGETTQKKVFALSIDRDTGTLHVTDAVTACNRVVFGWHILKQGTAREINRLAASYRRKPDRASKYLVL